MIDLLGKLPGTKEELIPALQRLLDSGAEIHFNRGSEDLPGFKDNARYISTVCVTHLNFSRHGPVTVCWGVPVLGTDPRLTAQVQETVGKFVDKASLADLHQRAAKLVAKTPKGQILPFPMGPQWAQPKGVRMASLVENTGTKLPTVRFIFANEGGRMVITLPGRN